MPARSWAYGTPDEFVSFDVEAELARVFGDGVRPLRFEEAVFDAMLAGWVRQQRARIWRRVRSSAGAAGAPVSGARRRVAVGVARGASR